MKKLNKYIVLILSVLTFINVNAQAPDLVNYQAVVRNGLGLPLNNQAVSVRFTIHQGTQTGPSVFQEVQATNTNQFGLINLELGSVNTASFSAINWGTGGAYYLQIEVDAGAGYDDLGASQLLSVPYALFARSAATGQQGFNSLIDTISATSADCPSGGYEVLMGLDTNANTVLDANEIITSFFVCNGSGGAGSNSDTSATNELQTLSINVTMDTIFLSNGGSVPLPVMGGDDWGTDTVNVSGSNITGSGTVANPLVVIDNDTSATNEIQTLLFNSADSNIIQISNGNGIGLSSTAPITNQVLTWNGANWVAQTPLPGTDNWGTDTVNISGSNITGSGTVANPLTVIDNDTSSTNELQTITSGGGIITLSNGGGTVTDLINDADADSTNELITNFSVNGTLDSLTITEGSVGYAIPLSDLSDGDWTRGTGNDIYNNADSIGIGTTDPKSLLQLGNYMHLFPLNINGNEDYSVSSYNIHWDGTTIRNTIGGSSGLSIMGQDSVTPVYSVMLFDPQPAGTDMMSVNPAPKMNLKGKGLGINLDNPDAALHVRPVDSSAILMEVPDDFSQPTLFYQSPSGDLLGLRVAPSMFGSSYTLTYPVGLPASNGSSLISDLGGNLSWGAPGTSLWNVNGPDIYNANTGRVGIGMISPTAILDVQDSSSSGAITIFNVRENLGGSVFNVTNDQKVNIRFPSGLAPLNVAVSGSAPEDNGIIVKSFNTNNHAIFAAQVAGSGSGDPQVSFNVIGQGGWSIGADNSLGSDFVISASKDGLGIAPRVVIDYVSGNFGIGTTSPGAPLHVEGNIWQVIPGNSTFIGLQAGANDNLGVSNQNTFVGVRAGNANVSGTNNTAIGYNAAQTASTGDHNTSMGSVALGFTTGSYNTAIGSASMINNLGGSYNTSLGWNSGASNTTGNNSVGIGALAGIVNTTGSNNTFIGYNANPGAGFTGLVNATAIGYNAVVSQSNSLILGNGVNVGIGTSTPFNRLDVEGNVAIGVNYSGAITAPADGLVVQGNVGIGTVSPGLIGGATKYLSLVNDGPYSSTSITSLEIKGNSNSANSVTSRIDLINGLLPTSLARIASMTSGGTTVQGHLLFYTNSGTLTERMRITDVGNVGIGLTNPTFSLQLATNSAAKPTSNVWTVASDARLKKDIKPFVGGLNDVLKINPVWFTYNGKGGMPNETGIGVIAQDLQKIAPFMVSEWEYKTDGEKYLGVDNGAMTYMLINAIKEQQKMIEDLKKELEELKNK